MKLTSGNPLPTVLQCKSVHPALKLRSALTIQTLHPNPPAPLYCKRPWWIIYTKWMHFHLHRAHTSKLLCLRRESGITTSSLTVPEQHWEFVYSIWTASKNFTRVLSLLVYACVLAVWLSFGTGYQLVVGKMNHRCIEISFSNDSGMVFNF